ncbi:MAG: glycosyltransferase family 4 protein [candidate division WOR-3 bacterium]|nr:glycosyltransferase family 4 protein [candidate division WOR-3 bacterium]MCX7948310.1 glycosyltransferase family 4 protein [candidate division WOR-3 bacterium]MDW8151144.1 glycosyltransferase family 4 protein [candidate division WOR-3 bacterium]
MKVLFLSDRYYKDEYAKITGSIYQSYLIAEYLSKKGIKTIYVSLSKKERHFFENENFEVFLLEEKNNVLLNLFKVLKFVKNLDFDVVYTRGRDYFVFIAFLTKKPYIFNSNAQEGLRRFKYISKLFNNRRSILKKVLLFFPFLILDFMIQVGIKNASLIVVQNEFQKLEAKRIWKKDAIIISNLQHKVNEYPSKKEKVVVWIGEITKWKKPYLLLEIAKMLKEYKFKLIGHGDLKLIEGYEDIENLEYLGKLSNEKVNKELERSYIVLNTSESEKEGISNAIIQGMMRGNVPICLNDDFGILQKYEVGFKVKDIYEMARTIKFLFENEEVLREYSRRAFEFSNSYFDYEKNGSLYYEVFKTLTSPFKIR